MHEVGHGARLRHNSSPPPASPPRSCATRRSPEPRHLELCDGLQRPEPGARGERWPTHTCPRWGLRLLGDRYGYRDFPPRPKPASCRGWPGARRRPGARLRHDTDVAASTPASTSTPRRKTARPRPPGDRAQPRALAPHRAAPVGRRRLHRPTPQTCSAASAYSRPRCRRWRSCPAQHHLAPVAGAGQPLVTRLRRAAQRERSELLLGEVSRARAFAFDRVRQPARRRAARTRRCRRGGGVGRLQPAHRGARRAAWRARPADVDTLATRLADAEARWPTRARCSATPRCRAGWPAPCGAS